MNYPKELKFKASGFDWKLKFIDITHDNFGETLMDKKEVVLFHRDHSHQEITETLIHELFHVVMYDSADAIFQFDTESNMKKEENAIRLLSPKLFALMRENPKLMKLIGEMLDEC